MDSRKGKGIAKPRRGKGSRQQMFRPPTQTQQSVVDPYYHPAPLVVDPYYPQPYVYNHPPPPRPMHPNNYLVRQTAEVEFEPLEPYAYRDTLPGTDDDDNDDVVPETQQYPFDEDDDEEVEVQEVTPKKFSKRAEKKNWTAIEEEALAKSWVHISTCKVVGNEQGRDKFWERVLSHFSSLIKNTTRIHHSLNTKWTTMNQAMNSFNDLYIQSHRLWESGCKDIDVLNNALADYSTKNKGKPFTHLAAWEVVRDEAKWLAEKTVGQTSSCHSDKRRKSSEGGNYESASNDADTILPDLNENTTPSRARKGKKSVGGEASSKISIAETVDAYAARKTKYIDDINTKQQALLDLQLEQATRKAVKSDFKFFNKPHDHITDPVMLSWMIEQKNQIAAKYGWHCDL